MWRTASHVKQTSFHKVSTYTHLKELAIGKTLEKDGMSVFWVQWNVFSPSLNFWCPCQFSMVLLSQSRVLNTSSHQWNRRGGIITLVLFGIKLRVNKFQSIPWQTFFFDMIMKNFLHVRETPGISKQIGSIIGWEKYPLSYLSSPALSNSDLIPSEWLGWETIIQKDTCTPMFTAALFTIAKTWKQPKCPSKKMNG